MGAWSAEKPKAIQSKVLNYLASKKALDDGIFDTNIEERVPEL
jgi:hypothetical protein